MKNFIAVVTIKGNVYQWKENRIKRLNYNNEKFIDLKLGGNFGVAISKNYEVFAWGENECGELGLGSFDKPYFIENLNKINYLNGKNILSIDCGENHVLTLGNLNSNEGKYEKIINQDASSILQNFNDESVDLINTSNFSKTVNNSFYRTLSRDEIHKRQKSCEKINFEEVSKEYISKKKVVNKIENKENFVFYHNEINSKFNESSTDILKNIDCNINYESQKEKNFFKKNSKIMPKKKNVDISEFDSSYGTKIYLKIYKFFFFFSDKNQISEGEKNNNEVTTKLLLNNNFF